MPIPFGSFTVFFIETSHQYRPACKIEGAVQNAIAEPVRSRMGFRLWRPGDQGIHMLSIDINSLVDKLLKLEGRDIQAHAIIT
jgi:hypothetical protein